MLDDLQVGDEVRLKKAHPCGETWWRVVRVGADVGLVCLGCARRIMLPRAEVARRVRERRSAPQDDARSQ